MEVFGNIPTNAPSSKVLHKKRKLEDNATREIIIVKRQKLSFEAVYERTKPKLEKLILRIEPKPPPQAQKYELHHERKERKGEGYEIWHDKWPWKLQTIYNVSDKSFSKEPP